MNKKLFTLLISYLLMVGTGMYAQSTEFVWVEDETLNVPIVDTVVQQPEEIQVLQRTWGVNLEDYLRDIIITLSTNPTGKSIQKKNILYVYQVNGVPCKTGNQTVYLTMSNSKDFVLSKDNPVNAEEICGCFLDLKLPEKVTYSPGAHPTDDEDAFGQPSSDGTDIELPVIEF